MFARGEAQVGLQESQLVPLLFSVSVVFATAVIHQLAYALTLDSPLLAG